MSFGKLLGSQSDTSRPLFTIVQDLGFQVTAGRLRSPCWQVFQEDVTSDSVRKLWICMQESVGVYACNRLDFLNSQLIAGRLVSLLEMRTHSPVEEFYSRIRWVGHGSRSEAISSVQALFQCLDWAGKLVWVGCEFLHLQCRAIAQLSPTCEYTTAMCLCILTMCVEGRNKRGGRADHETGTCCHSAAACSIKGAGEGF